LVVHFDFFGLTAKHFVEFEHCGVVSWFVKI
jgi:hypothetical protein